MTPFDLPAAIMSKGAVKGKGDEARQAKDSGQSFDNQVSHGEAPEVADDEYRGRKPIAGRASQHDAQGSRNRRSLESSTKTGDAVKDRMNDRVSQDDGSVRPVRLLQVAI